MYQHDRAKAFQFVLHGDLVGERVQELEHAWTTAKSILGGKELVVDVSGITYADKVGMDLLARMRDSGARLTAPLPPGSEEFPPIFGTTGSSAKRWVHQDQSAAVLPRVPNKLIASVPGIPA